LSLIKKIDGYYFRGFIPKKLQQKAKQKTIDKKLHTNNKKEAQKLIKDIMIEFNYYLLRLKKMNINFNKDEIIKQAINEYIEKQLQEDEENLFNIPNQNLEKIIDSNYYPNYIKALEEAIEVDSYIIIEYNEVIVFLDEELKTVIPNLLELNKQEIEQAKKYLALKLLKKGKIINDRLLKGNYTQRNKKANENEQKDDYLISQLNKLIPVTKDYLEEIKKVEPNLEKYFNEFLAYSKRNNDLAIPEENKYKLVILTLLKYFNGDIDIKQITRKDIEKYRTKLEQLPKGWSKFKLYKNLKTLDEIIETNNKQEKPIETLSLSTIQPKYMRILNKFFEYAVDNDYILKNPANNLKYGKKLMKEAKKEYKAFTNEELELIFKTPFYTKGLENNIKNKIEKALAPIISLYTTMRLNEIASLYIEDIKQIDNIYFFDINNNKDKTVKADTSSRYIPIHTKLIELGFINYYKYAKDKGYERLWPTLNKKLKNKDTEEGIYGYQISDTFNNLIDNYITKDRSRVFHSLRKNAIDNLKQNGVDFDNRYEISGHSKGKDSDRRMDTIYTNPKNAKILYQDIQKIKYEVQSLDLIIENIGYLTSKFYNLN